ncbi:ATP-grasp domain-containing protein [Streptomonospora sp. S1-112]|uniref:ATP-grasp domain-containing protein n=1 Tax=Streptomonospora mangrovi TaxID=2883123 RepID=A0A9X3NPV8_9ACTN|nr:ATP-grasp domain-containing protein [Streptomonospora mangrovi]MDA0566086.1 ATP-grasp domain-containing protein [Streptomonospora mangrovi]
MSAAQPIDPPAAPPTVVVTTAGSAPTAGTVQHLRALGYRVVATDIDPSAPGLYLADRAYLVPPGGSEAFVPELRGICLKENAVAVVPLVDEELVPVAALAGDGIAVLLPRPEFVAACLDKYALMRRLEAAGLPVPRTALASRWSGDPEPPLVVKPRTGRGSRGVTLSASAEDLNRLLTSGVWPGDQLVVQEQVSGPEYTVSVVVWRDGEVQAVVPKEVILKQGVTRFAVTRRHDRIAEVCRAVQRELRADGPFNVQLALDADGEPRVFEINPRFSSTAPLTAAAGVDEIGGLLRQAVAGGPRLADDWREGVVMVRRSADEFLEESRFAEYGLDPAAGVPAGWPEPRAGGR